jgi:glycosidase
LTKIEQLQRVFLGNSNAPYPGLSAVYDFDESGTSREALLGNRGLADVASYWASDYFNTIAGNGDPLLSYVHLEIPDWNRFLTGKRNAQTSIVAASYLFTIPGQPIINAGQELGLNQDCNFDNLHAGNATGSIQQLCETGADDSLKRQDVFLEGPWRLGSADPLIQNLTYIGPWQHDQTPANWKQDSYLNTNSDIFRFYRKLTHIRRSCGALLFGSLVWRYANSLMSYSRIFNKAEIVIVINPGYSSQSVPPIPVNNVINFNQREKYVNLLDGFQTASVTYSNGHAYLNVPFQISAQSFLIFVLSPFVGPYDSHLDVMLCTQ